MCFLIKGYFQGKIELSYHLMLSWSSVEIQEDTNNCDSKNNNIWFIKRKVTFFSKKVNSCIHTHTHTNIVVQLLSHIQLFVTPWTVALQGSLSFTISWSLLKFMSIIYNINI